MLGFRKEWLAELDGRLAKANLPRVRVFVEQLDRRGIIEAIRGPARPGRLQRQYRLVIEDGLPEVIADDLMSHARSALAPTLQVLLTKMWERACEADLDKPRFNRALYEKLKAEGYLLADVLDLGLKAIGRWNPKVEQFGLALDLLAFHTTEFGSAAQRSRAELDEHYAHQAATLDGLVTRCKDNYLLIEAEPEPDSPTGATRLAHDLLAPLVQHRFRVSMAPGQRARRLLENRAPEWRDRRVGPVLDSTDLAGVAEGAPGMRAWTPDETRLVEASRRALDQQKAEEQEQTRRLHEAEERQRLAEAETQRETEQRLKDQEKSNQRLRKRAAALVATLVATVGVALLAVYLWRVAVRETGVADKKTQEANIATENAKKQTGRAEQNLRIANSRRIAALSVAARDRQLDRALLLAVEAVNANDNEPTTEARGRALRRLAHPT